MLAHSEKPQFAWQRCNLSEIATDMVSALNAAIASADLELRLGRTLPAIEGDRAQLRQVLLNLMTNASDAIGSAPGRIVLTTGTMFANAAYLSDAWVGREMTPGPVVFIEVTDNGRGVEAPSPELLADPLFVKTSTDGAPRLAVVVGIVRGHRGAIKITNVSTGGTAVRVLLPAATETVAVAAAPRDVAANAQPGARVLVIDDEVPVLRVASEMLMRAGFQVISATSGEEAIRLVEEATVEFDGVLLDMTMPRMNGAETFKRLRALKRGLPVVLMSGYASEEATSRFGIEGLAGFVQKPFLPATLVRAMSDAVRRPADETKQDA
jgi:two-component system, cell cycle sensor histidine kinase and response regulator CckA